VIKPNREEGTCSAYELAGRFHVIPGVRGRQIDKLTVRETRAWLNKIPGNCQCCAQGKTPNGRRKNAAAAHSATAAKTSRAVA
jgi:hypothetical protein